MIPASRFIEVLGLEIHYTEWGAADSPVAILAHGFGRTGRDFDELAFRLSSDWRVICPDMIGRGLSQWSRNPEVEYRTDFYLRLFASLLDKLEMASCVWVGTSHGGRLGMGSAAGALKNRIRRLVMNDVGPQRGAAVYERIGEYMANPPAVDRLSEMEPYFRKIYKPFGWLSDAQWRRFTETSSRRLPDGRFTAHYDPRVAEEMIQGLFAKDYWDEWDQVAAPTLVLRGAESDILSPEVAQAMTVRGPKAKVVELPGCGHAPALNVQSQIDIVADFLAQAR